MAIPDPTFDREWLPANLNRGWTYTKHIDKCDEGMSLLSKLTSTYKHSTNSVWRKRLYDGQIHVNQKQVYKDLTLSSGDLIAWERPPWQEPAVPINWEIIFDNGDLFVINKPSGLPVIAGGGFLQHTLINLLKQQFKGSSEHCIPKPVHRLGRFTSGVLICARKKESRAKLSALFRDSSQNSKTIQKIYRALAQPNEQLQLNENVTIDVPITEDYHPLMGRIWNGAIKSTKKYLPESRLLKASSIVKLIERRNNADLLEVIIKTGRPHQIRIHLAALGTPLIGDQLYQPKGEFSESSIPGQGGYNLHSHRIIDLRLNQEKYSFEATPPKILCMRSESFEKYQKELKQAKE